MVGEAWHWYWHLIVWVQKCVHIMHLSAAVGLDDNSATCIYGFGRSCIATGQEIYELYTVSQIFSTFCTFKTSETELKCECASDTVLIRFPWCCKIFFHVLLVLRFLTSCRPQQRSVNAWILTRLWTLGLFCSQGGFHSELLSIFISVCLPVHNTHTLTCTHILYLYTCMHILIHIFVHDVLHPDRHFAAQQFKFLPPKFLLPQGVSWPVQLCFFISVIGGLCRASCQAAGWTCGFSTRILVETSGGIIDMELGSAVGIFQQRSQRFALNLGEFEGLPQIFPVS